MLNSEDNSTCPEILRGLELETTGNTGFSLGATLPLLKAL